MSDGLVTVTLSVKDAEALRAWQRSKQGIGEMQQELGKAKRAVSGVAVGFKELSEAGKQAFDNQKAWARGLAAIEQQRVEAAAAAAAAEQAANADLAAKEAARRKQQAAGFTALSAMGQQAYQQQRAWTDGLANLDRQRSEERIARLHRITEQHRQSLGNVREIGGAQSQLAATLDGTIAKWVSIGAMIQAARKAVGLLIEAQKKVRGEEADVTFNLDTSFRQLAVQGQMSEPELEIARNQVFDIAERQAAKPEIVSAIAKQLISSGFDRDLVLKGGAAEELTKGMQASAMSGDEQANPKEFTEAITQFLLAQSGKEEGQEITKQEQTQLLSFENLSKAVRETQGLFLRRNIQFADLSELAKAAPALSRAGLDMTTQLAAFTKMRDVLGAEEAATSLRNIALRMQTAGASKEKTAALAEIGLTPADVDMEGESFEEALARLRDALATHGPAKQAGVLKKIFEERGGLGASVLIEHVEDIGKYRAEAKDTTAFERAAEMATSGAAAGRQRQETKRQRQRFGGEGATDELIAREIEVSLGNVSPVAGALARKAFETARAAGIRQDAALSAVMAGDQIKVAKIIERVSRARTGRGPEEVKARQERIKREREAKKKEGTEGGAEKELPGVAPDKSRQEEYARRAKQHADEEVAAQQAKVDKKAADARAKQDRAAKAVAAKREQIEKTAHRKMNAVSKAAAKLDEDVAADQRRIDDLRHRISVKQQIASLPKTSRSRTPHGDSNASAAHSAAVAVRRGPRSFATGTPKQKSAATEIREGEEMRRLREQLAEAERNKAKHEAEANAKRDESKEILAEMRDGINKLVRQSAPKPAPPPRPQQGAPATIGGN